MVKVLTEEVDMEKVIVRSIKFEERCPKCGSLYVSSLYCWPRIGLREAARCVKDKIYIHKFIPGDDLVVPRVVH